MVARSTPIDRASCFVNSESPHRHREADPEANDDMAWTDPRVVQGKPVRFRREERPLPRPAVPPDDSAARRALSRDAWFTWAVVSLCIVVFATMIVTMSLTGDWDDPMPPNAIAAWSVAGTAAMAAVLIARCTKVRSIMIASIVAIPPQALYWALLVMPAVGEPS